MTTARSDRAPAVAMLFAAIGLVAAIVGAIGAITLRIVDPAPFLPDPFGFSEAALVGFEVMGVAYASVGALLVVRLPRNAIGWCMVGIGVGYAVGGFAAAATFSFAAIGTEDGYRNAQLAGWLTVLFTTLGGLVFILGFIFPTGRGHTPGWDRLLRWMAIGGAPLLLMILFQPGHLHVFTTIENPFGVGPDLRFGKGTAFSPLIAAGAAVLVPTLLWSLISRYRLADSTERQQLKWFALSIALSIGAVSASGLGAVVSDDPPEIGLAVFGFAGALVPVAIGIAILRYHLYDIDRIISRTIAYAVVSMILGVIFVALLLSFTAIMSTFAGGETSAIAASTLGAFALFQPIRRRVQRAIDRRFDRARYDADQTVRALAGRLRDDIDLGAVCREIVETASATVRPATAGLWLRDRRP